VHTPLHGPQEQEHRFAETDRDKIKAASSLPSRFHVCFFRAFDRNEYRRKVPAALSPKSSYIIIVSADGVVIGQKCESGNICICTIIVSDAIPIDSRTLEHLNSS
jgi:hypothetical protein